MAVTLRADQVPAVQVSSGFDTAAAAYAASGGTAPTARSIPVGLSAGLAARLNENAARLDMAFRYGGSNVFAVAQGLSLTHAALVATVAAGHGVIEGLVELAANTQIALTDAAENHIWLLQGGTLANVTNSMAAPGGGDEALYLGRLTTAGGVVTAIDTSGVLHLRGGMPWRETADSAVPTDAPPATAALLTRTKAGLWLWDGTAHFPLVQHEFQGRREGVISASEVVLRAVAGRAFTVPIGLSGSAAKAAVAATASATFSVRKNGVEFGTITVAAAGTAGALVSAAGAAFAAGDVLSVMAPASADATLADLALLISGF